MASFEQCYQYVSLHTISLRSPGAFDWSTLSQTFPPLEFLFTSKISSLAPHPHNSNICLENVEFCILAGKSSDANVFAEFLVTSAFAPFSVDDLLFPGKIRGSANLPEHSYLTNTCPHILRKHLSNKNNLLKNIFKTLPSNTNLKGFFTSM